MRERNNEGSYSWSTNSRGLEMPRCHMPNGVHWRLMNHSPNPNLNGLYLFRESRGWGSLRSQILGWARNWPGTMVAPTRPPVVIQETTPTLQPQWRYANEILWACSVLICYFCSTQWLEINQVSSSSCTLKVLHMQYKNC